MPFPVTIFLLLFVYFLVFRVPQDSPHAGNVALIMMNMTRRNRRRRERERNQKWMRKNRMRTPAEEEYSISYNECASHGINM